VPHRDYQEFCAGGHDDGKERIITWLIEKELLDQLLAGRDPGELFAKDGLLDELKKALSERILNAEIDDHLEEERAGGHSNRRNGTSKKTVLTGSSKVTLSVPRDRAGTFDPKLIAKYQRRFPEFDDKIISMYARGLSVREIRGHLEEIYGIDVSPDLISAVTDAVLAEVAEWQNRALDALYPLVFFDAIRVKIRDEGFVRNKAVYIALGIFPDGTKEILDIWIEQTEGAKFWLRVMNELKNRGVGDILIAVMDGLKGFPDAINAVFPQTIVQTCIVHLIRHSLGFVSWKDRKLVVPALRAIYRAKNAEAGRQALEEFDANSWGQRYPAIAQSWRRNWEHVVPFFAFPEAVRRIIYTTNQIEALNSKLRRAVRTRGHFPNDDAAMKLLYLVLNRTAEEWKRTPREWCEAKTQFAILFGDRFMG
jgi:putative transposase